MKANISLHYGDSCPRCGAQSGIDVCPNGGSGCPIAMDSLPADYYSVTPLHSSSKTMAMVPLKPTEEMIEAGIEASLCGRPSIDDDSYVISIWNAIIAAAMKEGK